MQIDPPFSTLFNQHQPEEKQCRPQGITVCLRYVEINLSCITAVSIYGGGATVSDSFRNALTLCYCISLSGNEVVSSV